MSIFLVMASLEDAPMIHDMQLRSFQPLLQKYEDDETSSANLYGKLGYQRTGKFTQFNTKMTIVDYLKRI